MRSTWNCLLICWPSSVYYSIQNSITHRIFNLKSFWCRTQFRAKSQTWPIVTWSLFLTLTKNLIFKDLHVLTPTRSTIINKKIVESMFAPAVAIQKLNFPVFFITNVTLEWATCKYRNHKITLTALPSWGHTQDYLIQLLSRNDSEICGVV